MYIIQNTPLPMSTISAHSIESRQWIYLLSSVPLSIPNPSTELQAAGVSVLTLTNPMVWYHIGAVLEITCRWYIRECELPCKRAKIVVTYKYFYMIVQLPSEGAISIGRHANKACYNVITSRQVFATANRDYAIYQPSKPNCISYKLHSTRDYNALISPSVG